jgi:hypothetical protein
VEWYFSHSYLKKWSQLPDLSQCLSNVGDCPHIHTFLFAMSERARQRYALGFAPLAALVTTWVISTVIFSASDTILSLESSVAPIWQTGIWRWVSPCGMGKTAQHCCGGWGISKQPAIFLCKRP